MNDNRIFRIIKIIDEYNVIVNAGTNEDIKEKDKLEVFIKGEVIKDPDTGEDLGTLDTIKTKLIVKQLFPKFCVCGNPETFVRNSFTIGISPLLASKEEEKRLNIDSTQISGGFKDSDMKIKIGDLVRKSSSQS